MTIQLSTEQPYKMRLSPAGILHLDSNTHSDEEENIKRLQQHFSRDWREGWFFLSAERENFSTYPSIQFWQEIANDLMTEICHLPQEEEFQMIDPPGSDQLSEWILKAPPFNGGEYLSIAKLREMWNALNLWIQEACRTTEGIHSFLNQYAPKWQQVGRVSFHLAENKKDPERPFAFLATYSTGFGQTGKVKHLPLKKALDQYSGTNNRQALLKLLTPVQKAAETCSWVSDLLETGEIYQPLAWTVPRAYKFLSSTPELEASGLAVRIPNWWKKRSRPQVSVTVDSKNDGGVGVDALLNFNVEVALGGQALSPEEIEELIGTPNSLAFIRGQWVEVDNDKLQEALDHWKQLQNHGEVSFIDGMRLLAGAPSSILDEKNIEEQREWLSIEAGQALKKTLEALRNPASTSDNLTIQGVNATLRHYQKEGVSWLTLLSGLGLGACLADDMGLGKTLQILSLLVQDKTRTQENPSLPSILVVPASLLGNWKRESERFTPSLNLLFIHPSEMGQKELSDIAKSPEHYLKGVDLCVTTYSMLTRQEWLLNQQWKRAILDEAQAIKNAGTQQSRRARRLKAHARIALTGTPIENRLSDLWSLFDFLNPGLLGTSSAFKDYVKMIDQGHGNYAPLRKLLSPYILRRLKSDPKIISDLPEKIETPIYCQLTKEQVMEYQAAVNDLKEGLKQVEPNSRRGLVLQSLTRLKQICNHPAHYTGEGDYTPSQSGKFLRLKEICEELASRQERVLVFTQFSEIIEPLTDFLTTIFGRSGLILHGGTPVKKRKELVEEFQAEDGPPFFVLSLKAGGTGLTLTAASHVIHFDRWWNPAVENQATDRAFRIGQKKNVQVHKFITEGTLEEQIDALIASKKQLSEEILSSGEEVKVTELSNDELINLVSLDITKTQARE